MKLHEMVSEPAPAAQTDPCRLLSPYREASGDRVYIPGEKGREVISYPGGTVSVVLVEDEETGLVTRQFMRSDNHLGARGED